MRRKIVATSILAALLLLQACGASDFAPQLRVIVAASGPLINSLNLGDKRAAVIQDFADLASEAGDLATDIKACANDTPCKLTAVNRYEKRFWDVERRGHFKLSPKLQNIQSILQGVIDAAKLYYGGGRRPTVASGRVSQPDAGKELQERLEALRVAMRP